MSAAFDTIKHSTVLSLLSDAGCTKDEIRLVRVLLANTKLRIRVNATFYLETQNRIYSNITYMIIK